MTSSTVPLPLRPAVTLSLALLVLVALVRPAAAGPAVPVNDLDPTFGDGGIVTTDLPSEDEAITDVALQADGKIVAVGSTDNPDGHVIIRYLADGQLDPAFRISAVPVVDQLAVQPDGKIVVGGRSSSDRFALARLNADGTVDSTFGREGKVVTRFSDNADLQDLAVQPDGKIVAAGTAIISGDGFLFARYLSDGRLDASFGSNGRVMITLENNPHTLAEVAIQPDGKILGNGSLSGEGFGGDRIGLVRLNEDGTLDPTFGGDGIVVVTEFDWFAITGLAVQPDGRILSGGHYRPVGADAFGVARLLPDGTVDSSFGDGGLAHADLSSLNDAPEDVAVQPNGLIVQVGWTSDEGGEANVAVLWYRPDGSIYSEDERLLFGFSSIGVSVAVQPDGKAIVAGGGGTDAFTSRFGVARYNPA
jgi:uncharacterized delta-60 repeat protein